MASQRITQSPESDAPGSLPTISIVVLYADFHSGHEAVRLCGRLSANFERKLDFNVNAWAFEQLPRCWLTESIEIEMAAADLVIVAINGPQLLPAQALRSLDSWAGQARGRSVALVGILCDTDDRQQGECPVLGQLREIAARAGAEFFHTRETKPPHSASVTGRIFRNATTDNPSPNVGPPIDFTAPTLHWGIND